MATSELKYRANGGRRRGLAPLYIAVEVRYGPNYETLPATVILIWILVKLAEADAGVLTRGRLILMGASAGFLFILSPTAGLAAIVALALFHLLRAPFRQWWIAPASTLAVVGLLAGPWAVRNMHDWARRSSCATISAWSSRLEIIPAQCIRPIRASPT
jgi:hypothetical protein